MLIGLTAIFPIVNPLGSSPFFLALTPGYTPQARKALSWRVAINSFFLLSVSYFVGTSVLAFFGVSLPAVQVGGGLIVIFTGWTMLVQRDDEKEVVHRAIHARDPFQQAFYPLTLPLTVGPGAISVAITLGANDIQRHGPRVLMLLTALIGSALIAFSIFLSYAFSDRLARILGRTGMTVFMRLSSFLLVCLGVNIAWNGLQALLQSLTLHVR